VYVKFTVKFSLGRTLFSQQSLSSGICKDDVRGWCKRCEGWCKYDVKMMWWFVCLTKSMSIFMRKESNHTQSKVENTGKTKQQPNYQLANIKHCM